MEIEVLSQDEMSMKLLIRGTNPAFVNTLRRVLLADIPKMAIDRVEFTMGSIRNPGGEDKEYESKTPLFDEIIAHRLGMVPIPTDLELFGYRDDCTCEGVGCPNCELMYSLWKVGPCTVYSGDLELTEADEKFAIREKLIPLVNLNEKQGLVLYATAILGTGLIPLVNLNEKQGLVLYATAILGTGIAHAKWQAAHAIGYRNYPTIEIDQKACDLCGECVEACPRSLLVVDKKKIETVDGYHTRCNLCNSCEEVCEPKAIKVVADSSTFIFQFETDGALTAKEALLQAIRVAGEKFAVFRKALADIGA